MNLFVLDTNIILHLVRGKSMAQAIKGYLEKQDEPQLFIAVVSIAEAESLVKQKGNWSQTKVQTLQRLLDQFVVIDVECSNRLLIDGYVSIDAFSQGKAPALNGSMLNDSSRNMGKNDLWIAATAHALDATLLTTDGDFDHLHQVYFELKRF